MGDIEEFFLNFLQRNQVVAIVILAVLAVRFLLRNCPKKYSYWLWGIVGVRMMFDLPLSSPFSLFHLLGIFEERAGSAAAAAQKVTPAGVQTPAAMPGQNLMDPAGKIAALQTGSDLAGHGQPVLTVLFFLWIAGDCRGSVLRRIFLHKMQENGAHCGDPEQTDGSAAGESPGM